MQDCLFCKIIAGAIPCRKVYEDDLCLGFEDIAPKAPLHCLFVPKEHFASAAEITPQREKAVGRLLRAAAQVAREKGVAETGFRLVTNTGGAAGQTVFHLHVHLLGGRALGEMG